jgi:hypothetical protein
VEISLICVYPCAIAGFKILFLNISSIQRLVREQFLNFLLKPAIPCVGMDYAFSIDHDEAREAENGVSIASDTIRSYHG